jgi:hypothetical protein
MPEPPCYPRQSVPDPRQTWPARPPSTKARNPPRRGRRPGPQPLQRGRRIAGMPVGIGRHRRPWRPVPTGPPGRRSTLQIGDTSTAGLVEDKRRSESVSVASIICWWCVDQAERGRCLIPSTGLIEPAAGILGVSSPTRRRGTNPPEIIGTTKLSRCKESGFETIGCRRRHSFENGHKLAVSRAGRALDPRGYCHPTARSVAPANVELPRQADMTHSSNTRC